MSQWDGEGAFSENEVCDEMRLEKWSLSYSAGLVDYVNFGDSEEEEKVRSIGLTHLCI